MSLTRDEYVSHDATGLSELVRKGAVSPAELQECALDLCRTLNPKVNAFVEVFDKPLEFDPRGPFRGAPFAIKDLVCCAKGQLNENGSRLTRGVRATEDTELMRRFRAAGCQTIGRTASPEFGYCVTTEPVATGPVRNPWDLGRMAGGSSGGSAAAIAAGIVPFAHGNDGGGSLRIPAACTGIVGLKTSRGRVSLGPNLGDALGGLAVEFAMTRSVRDCAGLLDAVHGYAAGDPFKIAPPPGRYTDLIRTAPRRLRIALMTEPLSKTEVDPAVVEGAERAAALCTSLGHHLELDAPSIPQDEYLEATHVIWISYLHAAIKGVTSIAGRSPGPDTLEATTLACFNAGAEVRGEQLQEAMSTMNKVARAFGEFFEKYDVLLTPTLARPALPLGVLNANRQGMTAKDWTNAVFTVAPFTAHFNMTGQPAISLPLHRTTDSLPVGIQFVGRTAEEHVLLQLAAQLETATPWPTVAPLYRSL